MPLRLLDVVIPGEGGGPEPPEGDRIQELAEEQGAVDAWTEGTASGGIRVRLLAEAERVEGLLDALEESYGSREGFRVRIAPRGVRWSTRST